MVIVTHSYSSPPQIKKIIIMEKETTLTLIHTVWCGITFLQYKEQSTGTKGLNQSWYPMNDFWADVMSLMISGKDLVMDRLDQSGATLNITITNHYVSSLFSKTNDTIGHEILFFLTNHRQWHAVIPPLNALPMCLVIWSEHLVTKE